MADFENITVIWRDDGDDYMITEILGDVNSHPTELVMQAARQEYAQYMEAEETEQALLDLTTDGFDLIGMFTGEVVWRW